MIYIFYILLFSIAPNSNFFSRKARTCVAPGKSVSIAYTAVSNVVSLN